MEKEPQTEVVQIPKWIATLFASAVLTGTGTIVVSTIVGGEKLDRLAEDVKEIKSEQKAAIQQIYLHETLIQLHSQQLQKMDQDKTSVTKGGG